jgi:hypothetical protein
MTSSTDLTGIVVLSETQVLVSSYSSGIFIYSLAPQSIALHSVLYSGSSYKSIILPVLFSNSSARSNSGIAANYDNGQFVSYSRANNVGTNGSLILAMPQAIAGSYEATGEYLVLAGN